MEAEWMSDLTVAEFLKRDVVKVGTLEIPEGHCDVYRSERGWLVHVDRGAQLHRLIPCASRGDLMDVLRRNLGSGPFAELCWKLVGKLI
jgi:hypothetical protein